MTKDGIPKQRIVHCIRHLENLPEVVINGFPDKNLLFKTIKLSRDYVETVMNQKPNCKPLIDVVTKMAMQLKTMLPAGDSETKKIKSMTVNRLTAIAKRWAKLEVPIIIDAKDDQADSEEEQEEESEDEEE